MLEKQPAVPGGGHVSSAAAGLLTGPHPQPCPGALDGAPRVHARHPLSPQPLQTGRHRAVSRDSAVFISTISRGRAEKVMLFS